MKRPSHVDPSKDERRSRAPYNFVALPADIISVPVGGPGSGIVEHDRYVPGRHTGWIDISMTTETPLFVRCAPPAQHGDDIDDKRDVHRRHFFHHGDESRPVIPGSSIRGMVRSLVEIMAYGKMQWVSDKALVYRAVGDRSSLGEAYRTMMLGRNQSHMPNREMKFDYPAHQLSGGYLERKGSDWFIRPAKTYEGESFIHVRYEDVEKTIGGRGRQRVHDIYVVPTKRVSSSRGNRGNKALILNLTIAQQVSFEPKEGYVHAKLVESGHMGKPIGQPPDPHQKHMHCAIYDPDPNAEPIPIPFQMWARYMEDLAISRGERTKTRCLSGHEEPLFYLLDDSGDLVFFGPTMLFRVPYRCTIHSYIPEHLRRPSETDLAEAMFGAVGDSTSHSRSTNPAVRGRMFFEDAIWDGQGGNPFLEGDEGFRTPKILSSPKPTAFQHYLVQTQPNDRGTLCHYDSGPDATEIRGHKLYWHKKGVPDSDIFEPALVTDPRDTQHTIIRPVKPGTIFTGRIRFENLNDEELGALLSAVDLPPSKRHKLGMGKPYGMGSVRISCSLQLTDRQVRYSRVCTEDGQLELGLKDDSETARINAHCNKAFCSLVRAHDTERTSGQDDGSLWSIPRIARLGTMLEWNGSPPRAKTEYVGLDRKGASWCRDRRVLPTPEGVAKGRATVSIGGRLQGPTLDKPTVPGATTLTLKSGMKVRCALLEEKTKKGGWKARTVEGNLVGHIIPGKEPQGVKPGDEVELVVYGNDPRNLSFRWP